MTNYTKSAKYAFILPYVGYIPYVYPILGQLNVLQYPVLIIVSYTLTLDPIVSLC